MSVPLPQVPLPDYQTEVTRRKDQRLSQICWGLFLIMVGGLIYWQNVPPGVWFIGSALILLGGNAVRSLTNIPVRTGELILAGIFMVVGLSTFSGFNLPWLPILLILIGASLIFRTPTGAPREHRRRER
ncbi:MAG: hypothetical protein KIT87_08395 [Anaerolineae bacterium]|nr:hypothetical protein [Anaerolineae bacterium]